MTEAATPSAPAVEQAQATTTDEIQPDTQSAADAIPEWQRVKHKMSHLKNDDGTEVEMTWDEIQKSVALNKTITARGQEAAMTKKQAEAQIAAFNRDLERCKENPELLFELVRSMGLDPDEIAEQRVWKKIELEKMTPEQREAYDAKRERDELKAKLSKQEEKEKAEAETAMSQQVEQEIDDGITEALKLSGLKPTPRIVARMAELYQSSINAKGQLESPEVIAKKVRDWVHQDISEIFSADIPVSDLIAQGLLPDKLIKQIQQHLLASASKNVPSLSASRTTTTAGDRPQQKQKKTVNNWFD